MIEIDEDGKAVKNIYQRIAAVQAGVKYVPKLGRNEFHHYDYATEADLLSALRKLITDNGLTTTFTVDENPPIRVNVGDKGSAMTQILCRFTVINTDNPTEYITASVWGFGEDKGDKGGYKAYTGAQKYFFMKFFNVPTGDDPELDDGDNDKSKAKPKTKTPPAQLHPDPDIYDNLADGLRKVDTLDALKAAFDKVNNAKRAGVIDDKQAKDLGFIKDARKALLSTPAPEAKPNAPESKDNPNSADLLTDLLISVANCNNNAELGQIIENAESIRLDKADRIVLNEAIGKRRLAIVKSL